VGVGWSKEFEPARLCDGRNAKGAWKVAVGCESSPRWNSFSPLAVAVIPAPMVPQEAWVTGDKAYNDYIIEDVLNEWGLRMRPMRKENSKHPFPPFIIYRYFIGCIRDVVSTFLIK